MPSVSFNASAPAKESASSTRTAIAKSTFCFLHSPANIEIHSCFRGCGPNRGRSNATLRGQRFTRRQHSRNGLDDSQNFLSVEMRMHRQRQSRVGQRLARGEITRSITQVSQRGLKMQRDRVVDSAFDLSLKQRVANGVALIATNDEQVVAGFGAFGFENRQRIQRREQFAISRRDYTAALVPFVQLFQLGAKKRGLDRIEARVVAANLVRVVRQAPVIAEARYAIGDFLVVGRDRAAIAPGAKIFAGVESEAS